MSPRGPSQLKLPELNASNLQSPRIKVATTPLKPLSSRDEVQSGDDSERRAFVFPPFEPTVPLVRAVMTAQLEEVRNLILSQPVDLRHEFVNQHDVDGRTALFHSILPERYDIFTLLLDYGSDPNAQDDKRWTPLHCACALSLKKHIQRLVEFGSDPKFENIEYQQPHQMVPGDDQRQAMLALMNATFDAKNAALEEKTQLPATPQQRAYYRSLFDLADISRCLFFGRRFLVAHLLTYLTDHIGALRIIDVEPLLHRLIPKDQNELFPPKVTVISDAESKQRAAKAAAEAKESEKAAKSKAAQDAGDKKKKAAPKKAKVDDSVISASEFQRREAARLADPHCGLSVKLERPHGPTFLDWFRSADRDRNAVLNYAEFLYLCLASELQRDKDRLKAATKKTKKSKSKKA